MTLRFSLAVWAGKCSQSLLRLFGSDAAAFPGLVAATICPTISLHFAKQCSEGIVLVSGTNGKTTTCRLLSEMLGGSTKVISNRSGSNLSRGHISAFLNASSWSGRLQVRRALLETDEAVLPKAIATFSPKVVVLHNLFRDQLDRYGEVNSVARKWLAAIQTGLPKESILIANADDPNIAYIARESKHQNTVLYGIDDPTVATSETDSLGDAFLSPAATIPLTYTRHYFSHLGIYNDGQGFARPTPQYAATNIVMNQSKEQNTFTVDTISLHLVLPGLYNIYNGLAAVTTARILHCEWPQIKSALASAVPGFGRFEKLHIQGIDVTLCLIKNPAGATEVLREIGMHNQLNLCIIANDGLADGTDVSWYWDTNFELVAHKLATLTCAGTRALDIALRFKYANAAVQATVETTLQATLISALSRSKGPLFILTTYTAGLELQRLLTHQGNKVAYWKV